VFALLAEAESEVKEMVYLFYLFLPRFPRCNPFVVIDTRSPRRNLSCLIVQLFANESQATLI